MFKDKKFVRRLALALCLSLIVGLVPVGIWSAPVKVNAAPDTNLVVNGDFEASAELVNWKQTAGKATAVVAGAGIDSSNALNMVGKGQEVESDKFAVTSGAELTISFKAYQAAGAKGLTAYALWYNEDGSWYDPNGVGDINKYNDWCTSWGVVLSGEWQELSKVLIVPTGAAKVSIRFYAASSVGAESSIFIDNVTAVQAASAGEAVFAEDFNTNNNDAKLAAAGWTACENLDAKKHDVGVYDNAVSGYAVWVQTKADAWVQTPAIEAVAGATYTAKIRTKGAEGAANMKLIFVDANGAVLAEAVELIGTGSDWAAESVTAVAPENTANLYVYFSRNDADCGMDNLAVYADIPEATEPSTEATEPSTEATEPSTEATEPAGGKVVFEDNIEASNFKQVWALTKTAMPWSDAGYKYEGSRVLLIQGVNDTATSPAFAVVAGNTYTLSYYAKQHTAPAGAADAGTAQIRFLDANGAVIDSAVAPACAVADWTEKTITAVAPAGAVSAQLFFDSGDSKLIYVVDAIVVTETGAAAPEVTEPSTEATEPSTEATEPSTEATVPENLVFADDFEEHDKYDYTNTQGKPATNLIPVGWTSYDPSNIRVACNKKYFDVYEGYNLFFQEKKGDKWAKSPAFDVAAGNTYSVEFMETKMPGTVGTGAYVKVIFLDANGAVVDSETKTTGTSATWTADSLTVVAPAGAVAAQIEFGLESATGNPEFAVDNLRVYLVDGDAPEATEPSTEATEPSTEATEPTIAPQLGTIINGSFEDGVKYWNNTDSLTIDTNSKVTGNASVLFNDPDNRAYFVTQKVPVEAGKTYVLSAWVKIVSGKGGYIGMYDLGDANVATAFGSAKTWTYYTCEVTVPAGYSELTVEFGSHSGSIVAFMIDDLKLVDKATIDPDATEPTAPSEPVTEPTKPADGSVFSDTFEDAYTPDGAVKTVHIPVGWTASQHSAAIGTAGYDKYDGTENLCVQDPKDKWIRSPLIAVVEGYEYSANFVEKKYQPAVAGDGGYVKIVFVDGSSNILKEYRMIAGASAEWTEKVLLSKAPAGATHMYVEFGLENPTGEPTYSVDNLKVFETEASLDDEEPTMPTISVPTEPEDTNVMLGDDFQNVIDETNGNAGPLGWVSSDDVGGAYSAAISVGQYMDSNGNCLCLQTPGQWSITSDLFAARAGYEYTVEVVARKIYDNTNLTGSMTITFVDAWGKKLEAVTETVGKTYGAWAEESMTAVAPEGTVAAYLEFALDNADRKTKGDYAIDSLEVIKSAEPVFVPEATEPSNPGGGNSGTGDDAVLIPVFGIMAAVTALAVLVIKKRRVF